MELTRSGDKKGYIIDYVMSSSIVQQCMKSYKSLMHSTDSQKRR